MRQFRAMTVANTPSSPAEAAAMLTRAHEVIRLNIAALQALDGAMDDSLGRACDIILGRPGYLVVTGMGKSGHIGGKLAATLASTGTNAFFVHPAEMSHGDLGMLRHDTTLLAISNSGESRELRDPLIFCQREGIPVIGMTQRPTSFLGRNSAVCLTMPKVAEACPNNLAPTTSTLMTLALGAALAIITDGDVRRAFTRDIAALVAADIMSPNPKVVGPAARMSDVVDLIVQNKISNLFVTVQDRPVAIVHIAELMQAGYVS